MPAIPYVGFVGPSYVSQSAIADSEQLINWHIETMESEAAAARRVFYPTPGLELFTTTDADARPVRNMIAFDGRVVGVNGSFVEEMYGTGTFTRRGPVAIDDKRPTIVINSEHDQLFVTSGGHAYLLDLLSNVFTEATITGTASFGGMLDSRFLYLDAETSTFYISELDGVTFDPTKFTQRSTAPDGWRSMIVSGEIIWLFGEFTSDAYYNALNPDFTFEPFQGGLIQQGIAADSSAAVVGDSVIFLAQNAAGGLTVQQVSGISTQKISSYALDEALADYARVDDAEGWSYEERGHTFYVLDIPSQNVTWVYDNTEARLSSPAQAWHRRGLWSTSQGAYNVQRQRCHAFAFGHHLVGDRYSGAIYRQSVKLYLDAEGAPLRRMRRTPHLNRGHELIRYPVFEVYFEPGLGLSAGQGSAPELWMRKSDDGGKSWGSYRRRSAGAIGRYKTRARWLNCGSARDRVFEVVCTDPVPFRLTGAGFEAA
jgi:hypothetical protein